MTKEFVGNVLKVLGSLLWLKNNLHNFYVPEFKDMLIAVMEDADKIYWDLDKFWENMK